MKRKKMIACILSLCMLATMMPVTVMAEDAVAKIGETTYPTIDAAIEDAKTGDTVQIMAGTYAVPKLKAGITLEGVGEVLLEGTLSGTLEDITLKNLHIKGGNAQRWAYAKGNLVFDNVTFEATSVYALHFDGITAGATLLYKDCTIIGWAAMSGSPASCVFDGCTIEGNGTYGLIRTYFDATIKDCTFDVDNVNTEDIYQDGIHAVGANIKVEDCVNKNGDMKDIVNVSENKGVKGEIELDGVNAFAVAKVGDAFYEDLQEAIKAAAPDGTVEILSDVTVDKWIMFAESLPISNGNIITLNIDGLTINGNDHSLTVNSIESAGNGNRLFYDAENLNINDLKINYADGVAGGIGLQSGTIDNVTFNGGVYGVLPGAGDVTIKDSTFKTNGTAIYYEEERDNLTVTGNTFELGDDTNVILLRGDTKFTNNTIVSGRTVNVVSGSPVVTGNDFNDVRLKIYDDATAEIKNNEINVLAFEDDSTKVNSTFANNTLSNDAQAALDAAGVENVMPEPEPDPTPSTTKKSTKKYAVSIDSDEIENGSIKLSSSKAKKGATVTITVTPDAGYELDKLVVLDDDGDKVELTDKGNGKFTFKMPRGGVEVEASFVEIEGVKVDDEIIIVLTIDETLMLIDGEYVVNDVAPIIRGERTVLPIRVIAEALGATVSWNEAEQTVTIVKGEMTIVVYIGQAFALVNGEPVALDQPAFIENGRTYLPLRFIMENLGAEVTWDGAAQTVTIIG